MALRQFLLRLQLWATYDNTSRLRKRYMLLAGLVVHPLFCLAALLFTYADPDSGLRHVEGLAWRAAVLAIMAGLTLSGLMILFAYLCRLVRIANLYASMVLFGVVSHLLSNLWRAGAPPPHPIGISLAHTALFFGAMVAFAWLSLKFDGIFRKRNRKLRSANPGVETDRDA